MNSAATTYTVFGFPMQRRSARRRLVVCTYAVLLAICIPTAWVGANLFSFALYAALAVGIFVFGGTGRYGLIKSFLNKPPRPEPPVVDLVRLHLEPLSAGTPDESTWRNDERELERRNLAHYRAYQPISILFMPILLLSSWAVHPLHWNIPVALINQTIFTITLLATMLALTLPAAIILWIEPDLDNF